ncbi:MAG: hypothetical protein LBV80_07355 [Deltaproteobacteria bacterium]|jgi:hypothetical protein|nr:hypothetical protein [Deltaproteobacteria bacterium]
MPRNTDGFVYGLPRMSRIVDNARVPFTRYMVDLDTHPPYGVHRYKSMFELTAETSKGMADRALEDMVSGGAARTHHGQTMAGLISSGLSASALRVPETRTGAFVSVSL